MCLPDGSGTRVPQSLFCLMLRMQCRSSGARMQACVRQSCSQEKSKHKLKRMIQSPRLDMNPRQVSFVWYYPQHEGLHLSLSIHPPIHPSIYSSTYLSTIYLPIDLSICLVCLAIQLVTSSSHPFMIPSVCMYVCMHVCTYA